MKELVIYKAASIAGIYADDVTIIVKDEFPAFDSLEDSKRIHEFDAKRIEKVFHESLPGGTYDRLFAAMAERKASLYRVSNAG